MTRRNRPECVERPSSPGLVAAVHADLKRWGVEGTALAACALDLARRLEEPGVRPAAASMLHKELRCALTELQGLAEPQERPADPVDELRRRREARRGTG